MNPVKLSYQINKELKSSTLKSKSRFSKLYQFPHYFTHCAGRHFNNNPDLHGSNWSIGGKGNANGDYSELRTIVRRDGMLEEFGQIM